MKLRHAAIALGMVLASSASAQKPENITAGELAMLPEFCIDTYGFKYGSRYFNPSPRAPYWVSKMGLGFWTMHHYCWARIHLHRVKSQERNQLRRVQKTPEIIGNLEFVIKNTGSDFPLLPEIYTRLAEAELIRNNPASAFGHIETALRHKPSYAFAYATWAEYLISTGQVAKARDFLARGLASTGGAESLRELYAKAGGNPDLAVPTAPATPASDASASPPAPGRSPVEPAAASAADQ